MKPKLVSPLESVVRSTDQGSSLHPYDLSNPSKNNLSPQEFEKSVQKFNSSLQSSNKEVSLPPPLKPPDSPEKILNKKRMANEQAVTSQCLANAVIWDRDNVEPQYKD